MAIENEKLKKLNSSTRIGGKGTQRRKKKIVHKPSDSEDRKLQNCLKKLGAYPIPGFEEVTMFQDDATVLLFKDPKVCAAYNQNTYAIEGTSEVTSLADIIPLYLRQLSPESIDSLTNTATNLKAEKEWKDTAEKDYYPMLEEV